MEVIFHRLFYWMRLIPIADIVSAHGIKGGLKVYLYNTDDPLIYNLKSVYAGTENDNSLFRISRIKKLDKRFCIINLEGVITRHQAESYRNRKLFITPDMLPPLPENFVYLSLLVGFCVFDQQGSEVGVVEDFINTGAQDVMIVKSISASEFMVPFVDEFIKKIDIERCQIFINMMEGLLD